MNERNKEVYKDVQDHTWLQGEKQTKLKETFERRKKPYTNTWYVLYLCSMVGSNTAILTPQNRPKLLG